MNIEELAFKNYYELINIQKIDLLLIIEFLQKDRRQWINQFSKTHNESVEIQARNRKLKDNWNKLKMWLNNFHRLSTFEQWEIVNKMQELEQGGNVDERRRKRSNERASL